LKNLDIEISKTIRGKEQVILDRKYKFNFSSKKGDLKKYKCTEYKTLNNWPSFIILNDKNEPLEYNNQHSHHEQRYEASKSIIKCKITDKIINSPNPYNVNTKRVYDGLIEGMDIFPPYDTIKSQLARTKRKLLELLPDIKTFDEIPDESEYYKTKSNESYMVFKNNNLIIFQFPFQAVLFSKYEDVFADGTFYIAPIFANQVFITRTFVKELNGFYTTSFSILENKSQITYLKK